MKEPEEVGSWREDGETKKARDEEDGSTIIYDFFLFGLLVLFYLHSLEMIRPTQSEIIHPITTSHPTVYVYIGEHQ